MKKLPLEQKRILVVSLIIGSVLYLLFFPIIHQNNLLSKKIEARQKDWQELSKMVKEHQEATGGISNARSDYSADLLEHLLEQIGAKPKISALRPKEGPDRGFDIELAQMSPNEISAFLLLLQKERIKVEKLQLRGYRADGLWNLQLYLKG